jgi:hypothetical protein
MVRIPLGNELRMAIVEQLKSQGVFNPPLSRLKDVEPSTLTLPSKRKAVTAKKLRQRLGIEPKARKARKA